MPDVPRPQTDQTPAEQLRTLTIEAAAPVLWAHVMADDPLIEAWTDAEPGPQRETRETVAAVYDAMAPLVRRAVAEEIRVAAETTDINWAKCFREGMREAARIAREIGERHV